MSNNDTPRSGGKLSISDVRNKLSAVSDSVKSKTDTLKKSVANLQSDIETKKYTKPMQGFSATVTDSQFTVLSSVKTNQECTVYMTCASGKQIKDALDEFSSSGNDKVTEKKKCKCIFAFQFYKAE